MDAINGAFLFITLTVLIYQSAVLCYTIELVHMCLCSHAFNNASVFLKASQKAVEKS